MKLQYLSSVLCNEAGQSVLSDKVRQAIQKLNRDWRFCNAKGNSATCNNLNVNIKCERRHGLVKRQIDTNDDVYDIEISFPAGSDPVTNINTQEKSTIERLLETIILEQDDFDVSDSLPTTVPDPATLSITADFTCPVGQVVRGTECVACAPGNFFDTENKICKTCRVGAFQVQHLFFFEKLTLFKSSNSLYCLSLFFFCYSFITHINQLMNCYYSLLLIYYYY